MENSQKGIRSIPIWIEGRKEWLNNDTTTSNDEGFSSSASNDQKKFCEPHSTNHSHSSHTENVATQGNDLAQKKMSFENAQESMSENSQQEERKHLENSMTEIQKIQSSVLDLMKKIDEYSGDKRDYAFIDEMLTQCLIKLDNIDTNIDVEGKENVKNALKEARREAIRCINSLITLLEEKHEEFKKSPNTKEQLM